MWQKFYDHLGDWVKLVADLDVDLKSEHAFPDSSQAPVHIQLMHHLQWIGPPHKQRRRKYYPECEVQSIDFTFFLNKPIP
jgi:hypothetical protein